MDATVAATPLGETISLGCAAPRVNRFAGRASRSAVAHVVARLRLPNAAVFEVGCDGSVREIAVRLAAEARAGLAGAGGHRDQKAPNAA